MPDGTCQGETENRELDKRQRPRTLSCPRAQTRACVGLSAGAGRTGDLAPLRTLSPKSRFASQQRASGSSCWMFLLRSTAQGTGLGRDSGCTCWIRSSQQSPGKLARASSQLRSGPGQQLGWGPGAKRGLELGGEVVQGAKAGTWGKS